MKMYRYCFSDQYVCKTEGEATDEVFVHWHVQEFPQLAQFRKFLSIAPLWMQDHLPADTPARNITSEGWLRVH